MAQGTTVLNVTSGQVRDEVDGVPLARRVTIFLLLDDSPGYGNLNGTALDVLIWDSASMKTQHQTFTVPPRPGCSSLVDDFPGFANQADGQFLILSRRDNCGIFTTRYDWHLPENQTPVILPGN